MNEIETIIHKLNLNKNETLVLLTIARDNVCIPAQIAKIVSMPRSTTYATIDRLVEKNFLVENRLGKSSKVVRLNTTKNIIAQLQLEKKKLLDQIQTVQQLSKVLPHEDTHIQAPAIRYVEGKVIEQFLKERTPVWESSMRKCKDLVWRGMQDGLFPEIYHDWIQWYWNRKPKGFKTELISGKFMGDQVAVLNKQFGNKRELKVWQPLIKLSGTLWVHGDYIVLLVLRKQPRYLIEIKDADLAYNLRLLFKTIWQITNK